MIGDANGNSACWWQGFAAVKRRAVEQHRSHRQPDRCAACGFRAHYDERLPG